MKLTYEEFDKYVQNAINDMDHLESLYDYYSEKVLDKMFDHRRIYLEMLEVMCGDTGGWIDYYIYETDCGKKDMEITINDEIFIMKNTKDLYDMISRCC